MKKLLLTSKITNKINNYNYISLFVIAEVFVDPDVIEDVIDQQADTIINLAEIFYKIYDTCDNSKVIKMEKDAYEEFKSYQRDVLRFRQDNLFEEARLSIKSKSVGIMVRLAGICCLLREAVEKENGSDFKLVIQREDIKRAIVMVKYSNAISFFLLDEKAKVTKGVKRSLPEPEDLTVEFLIPFNKKVKLLVTSEFTYCSSINRNNLYPIINNERSNDIGNKFIKGLVNLGFGKMETREGKPGFKPFNPNQQDCKEQKKLKSYWEILNITNDEN